MKNKDLYEIVKNLLQERGYIILASNREEYDFLMFGYRAGFKTSKNNQCILVFANNNEIGWNRLEISKTSQILTNIHDPKSLTSLIEELN